MATVSLQQQVEVRADSFRRNRQNQILRMQPLERARMLEALQARRDAKLVTWGDKIPHIDGNGTFWATSHDLSILEELAGKTTGGFIIIKS